MERKRNGTIHGYATDVDPELGAAAGRGAGPRPRAAAVRARAVRSAVEERRRGASACGRPARPLATARPRYAVRLARALPSRRSGGPAPPPPPPPPREA